MSHLTDGNFADLELYGFTTCVYCNKTITQDTALVKTYFTDEDEEQQETFCSVICHDIWYIDHLQQAEV